MATIGAAQLLQLALALWAVPSEGFVGRIPTTIPGRPSFFFNMAATAEGSSSASGSESLAPSLDAILWDMDGVLAETERDAHRVAFNQVFDSENLNTDWDVESYGKLLEVGGGKERMTAHWNAVGWPDSLKELDDATKQQKVKEFHLQKTDLFNDLIGQGVVPLRPGVERLIDEAMAAGKTLAVCSTSNEKAVTNLVKILLGETRASEMTIFAGDIVANKKPAPDVYNLAVDTLELDKSRCLIVEDSGIGWGAAKAAGIACIVTKSVYTAHEDFTGANLVVTDLDGTDGNSDPVTLSSIEGLLNSE
jgi:HAD superfamily hydrolase (TIGR01509 family)